MARLDIELLVQFENEVFMAYFRFLNIISKIRLKNLRLKIAHMILVFSKINDENKI